MQTPPQFSVGIVAEAGDAATAPLAHARDTLNGFGVPFLEATLDGRARLAPTVDALEAAGARVFVAINTSPDPLSSAVAQATSRPVLAVPVEAPGLTALDALRTTTQAGGPPVGTLAIGKAGAVNAALLAVAILANADPALAEKLRRFRDDQTAKVLADRLE